MMISFFYIILAMLGLSFLIFIHELGHYFMARRVGMRVETFSIGFGHPICSWMRDGTKWQIGWILFGGYVKISGMDTTDSKDPYEVPEGFFSKGPFARIKVAFMGPFVNLVFAFLAFAALWIIGGREKSFSEYTAKIGWVDPNSELYADGIRPGDEITAYNGNTYEGAKDHLYAPMTASSDIQIDGYKIKAGTGDKIPFEFNVKPYAHPSSFEKGIVTAGILSPASYLIYDRLPGGGDNLLPEGSPMENSGIQYGDRIVWADGELIYSTKQLSHLLNDKRVLLTVKRGNETILRRVPKVLVQELKLDPAMKEELIDWQFESGLNGTRFQQLYALPYNLNNEAVVEGQIKFIDKENEVEAFPEHPYSDQEAPLHVGDKIIAVEGTPVAKSYYLLGQIQRKQITLIVERSSEGFPRISWNQADANFDQQLEHKSLQAITSRLGTTKPLTTSGNLFLLKTVTPKVRSEFILSLDSQVQFATDLLEQKKAVAAITDPDQRAKAMALLEERERQLLLGLPALRDRQVNYNPNPVAQFDRVVGEIYRTLGALFSGSLNPKWLSGPIGIVQVVHDSSMVSTREALYWLGAISLNLGLLNLLPLPVLDGGTICLSFFELITGKRLKAKTLEKVVIPFAILLIGFFIYLTYNDLSRLFTSLFH
jgi:regulator of sigma E protease